MAQKSKIEWTEATWNPIVGCSIVSPGCTNCYAMKMAARLDAMGQSRYVGLTKPSKAGAVWTGETRLVEEALTIPLRRKKPTTWFVNSMSDLFHESVPDAWIDRVFAVMGLGDWHTYQVLTKRSARMQAYMSDPDTLGRIEAAADAFLDAECERSNQTGCRPLLDSGLMGVLRYVNGAVEHKTTWPFPKVWLGVSAEDQRRADERVPDLLATPAAVRFVSAEPLLGPIDFMEIKRPSPLGSMSALPCGEEGQGATLDWIIVGGESGPNARPMHPAWARSIRDQCAAAGVAFHFKQHGAWISAEGWYTDHPVSLPIRAWTGTEWTDDMSRTDLEWVARVGKKAAGRLLDGVEHNGMPRSAA